ncbi:MAG: NHL repeat-containing protein [Blastocatellales bacterium]
MKQAPRRVAKEMWSVIGDLLRLRTPLVLLVSLAIGLIFALRPGSAQTTLYVTTVAGISSPGYADGQGVTARFNAPLGIAIDAAGDIIVADFRNARVRRVTPDGKVTTIAGGASGFANGPGDLARFFGPAGVAVDSAGNIIVADYGNHRIRRIDPNRNVTTIAGTGQSGRKDGPAAEAEFSEPTSVAIDDAGRIYVLDSGTNLVRRIDASGMVTTIAGSINGYADGQGSQAAFSFSKGAPQATFDLSGNLIIGDFFNSVIRRVTPSGLVTTIAGGGSEKDGPALQASFFFATAVARDSAGDIIIGDWHNAQIRKLDMTRMIVSTIAGSGIEGHADGFSSLAQFVRPGGVAVAPNGDIFVSDYADHCIRKVSSRYTPPTPTPTPSPTPTPTPAPTPTPTPAPTPTPTPTPSPTPTPTPIYMTVPAPQRPAPITDRPLIERAKPSPTPTPNVTGTPLYVIENPGFETGDYSGWRIFTYFIESGGAFVIEDLDVVTEGRYALRFQANGRKLVDYCAQDLTLAPGNYTITCDVAPSFGAVATLGVDLNDGSADLTAASPPGQKAALVVNFTVSNGSLPVTIYAVGNQSRYVRSNFAVDNFRLYKK